MHWKKWLVNGDAYLRGAGGKDGKPSKFNGAIRYNLLSLALESFVMAILDHKGTLPDNHTFTDFIDGLQRVVPLTPDLRRRILVHEDTQSICSIDAYHRHEPSDQELDNLHTAVGEIRDMAHTFCIGAPPVAA